MQVRHVPKVFALALALVGCVAGAPTGASLGGSGGSNGPSGGGGNVSGNTGGTTGVPGGGPEPRSAPPQHQRHPRLQGGRVPGPRRLRLLTRAEYANTVADLLGIPVPTVDNLPVESVVDGFDNNAAATAVTSRHLDEYLATSERLAAAGLAQSRGQLLTCQAARPAAIGPSSPAFGRRAFRRPLADAEVSRYQALFDPTVTGGNFDKGVELVMRAMLASPIFLYRSEVGEKAPRTAAFRLTRYEVATALSYFFWETTPGRHPAGRRPHRAPWTRPDGVEAQARRLLADPRSRPGVAGVLPAVAGHRRLPVHQQGPGRLPHLQRSRSATP